MADFNQEAGLQNERTALSWQRTSLAMVVLAALVCRLSWSEIGVVSLTVPILGLALAAHLVWRGRLRYAERLESLDRGRPLGRQAAMLSTAVAAIAVLELTALYW